MLLGPLAEKLVTLVVVPPVLRRILCDHHLASVKAERPKMLGSSFRANARCREDAQTRFRPVIESRGDNPRRLPADGRPPSCLSG